MKLSSMLASLSLLALFASVNVLKSATQLMPGLTYYHGKEKLSGKLVFAVWKSDSRATNSDTDAAIYELDLSDGRLRKVTECPKGILIPDRNSDARCIIFWIGDGIQWMQEKERNAFIVSNLTERPRKLEFEGSPKATVVTGGHVFFQIDIGRRTSLLDYDIVRDHKRIVEFDDASRWKYEKYDRIHAPRGQTNALHFQYTGYGDRIPGPGRDYRSGFYNLDISSGDVRWFAEPTDDDDDVAYKYKASDGRYIFFEGPNSPIHGLTLVSSPWDDFWTKEHDPKKQKVRVLKRFSILSAALGGGFYSLEQISPDGRFAFVQFYGSVHTYYLVDVSTGITRVLLKRDPQAANGAYMSEVWWVAQ